MEFVIENNPNGTLLWWASTKVDENGNEAIGGGNSVWEAIGNCLLDVPATLERLETLRTIVRGLKKNERPA